MAVFLPSRFPHCSSGAVSGGRIFKRARNMSRIKIKQRRIPLWTRNWARDRGIAHVFFEETESASGEARSRALRILSTDSKAGSGPAFSSGCAPAIFIAASQTAGRGRKGAIWENSDLMASWLWGKSPSCGGGRASRPAIPPNLSWDFARDLLSAAKAAWPCILWRAKPPNDLYIKDKKIAGILPEILDQGAGRALILGLGLNVFSHPAGIPNAGHLQGYEKSLAGVSPADVSPAKWEGFLDRLHALWTERAWTAL